MVGCPGSGKSYFAVNNLFCHDRMKIINRDTLGSWQKCIAKTTKYLSSGSVSVVIDHTNPDVESRKRFIDIAKMFKIPCRVFLMKVSKEHGKHNNKVRVITITFPFIYILYSLTKFKDINISFFSEF